MFKHKMAKALGLSQKKVKRRLDDIKLRYGIVETNEQDGKQVILISYPLPGGRIRREYHVSMQVKVTRLCQKPRHECLISLLKHPCHHKTSISDERMKRAWVCRWLSCGRCQSPC